MSVSPIGLKLHRFLKAGHRSFQVALLRQRYAKVAVCFRVTGIQAQRFPEARFSLREAGLLK